MKYLKLVWSKISKLKIEVLLSIIWLILSYLSFFIALPFYHDYKDNNNIPNLNWNWSIIFLTEETTFDDYRWMPVEYNMFFLWDKNLYEWRWEKIKIWWNDLVWNQRDRTEMKLSIKNDDIYGIYYLFWKDRDSDWSYRLKLSPDWNSFSGTFIWNAADSRWSVTWVKIN